MNINNVDYINCTGCAACSSICHSDAIIMQENMEGFKYPKVIEEKCTDCNICVKICPALNISDHINKNQLCYAVKGQDDIRYKSSSGGFFTYIAEYVIEMGGGCVAGAAFDENLYLSHIIVDNKQDLEKLKKSKYIQSDINNTFREIKKLLKNDRYVLFSGTPCQVAGLKSYLKKDYDNLITLDLVCHGVPPQKLFHKYLNDEFPNEKITGYDFRDKSKGWEISVESIKTENNEIKRDFYENAYGKAFIENLSLRKCCGKCDYANLERQGDITIGDFWGINAYNKNINDNKGVSLILVNSIKGKNFFNSIKGKLPEYMQIPIDYAVRENTVLKKPVHLHINRSKFFKELENKSLDDAYNTAVSSKEGNIGIINFSYSNWNFGAVLTGYALQHYLRQEYKDKNIFNIQFDLENSLQQGKNIHFEKFRNQYFNQTEIIPQVDIKKFIKYISTCETILYGSDQIFRFEYINKYLYIYLGILSKTAAKLISIAAGFGDSAKQNIPKKYICLYQNALKRFSAISVREEIGLEICKQLGISNANLLIDPVFLLEEKDYMNVHNSTAEKVEVFVYKLFSDEREFTNNELSDLVNKIGYKKIKTIIADERNCSIEEWLTYIAESDFIITSSFHGAAFAIIFEKEFIFINKYEDRIGRINSLAKQLNINSRVYSEISDIDIEYIRNNKIDYNKVKEKLANLKKHAKEFIRESIAYKITDNEITDKKIYLNKILKIYKKMYINVYIKYKIYSIKLKLYKFFGKYERIYNKYILIKERKNEIKFILKQLKKNL